MTDTVFFASPHKDGHCAVLVREYTARSEDVRFFDLYASQPLACNDCGGCAVIRGCALHDLDGAMEAFEQADRVIFAFPVYNLSFPAPMKALFDRFQRYYNARFSLGLKPPIEKRRKAILLMSCGRAWKSAEGIVMPQIEQAFSVLNLEITDIRVVEDTDK